MLSEAKIEYALELQTVPQPQYSSLRCVDIRIFLFILDKKNDVWRGHTGERFIFIVGCLIQWFIYCGVEARFGVDINAGLTFFFSFVRFQRSV